VKFYISGSYASVEPYDDDGVLLPKYNTIV